MHNVLPYISVSPCSQVLDTELDSHCTMLHFLLHNVFSHQIFVDIFHNCNVLPILLLPLLIPLLSFNSIWSLYNFTHTSTVPHAGILYFTAISLSNPSPARYASTTFLLNSLVYNSFAGFSSNAESPYAWKILIHLWTVVIHTFISCVRLVTDSLPSKYLLHISIFSSHKKTSSANSDFNYLHCLLGGHHITLQSIILILMSAG